jgi:DNA-binding response OmpR family regulator
MRKKILVVDDDDSVRESLMNALSYENYRPLGAADGEEALALLETEDVELVLLDLNMPRRNGWETYEAISKRDPLLPIIIITARPNQLFTSLGAGVGALVEKPFDFLKLVGMIRSLIAESTEKRVARATGQVVQFHYVRPNGNDVIYERSGLAPAAHENENLFQ